MLMHYEKIGWFAISFVIDFWDTIIICNSLQFIMFLWGDCYWTSCMSFNEYNSLYVKLYTYATQLQMCKNKFCIIIMQLVCNYYSNIIFHWFIKIWHMALWEFFNDFFLWNMIFTIHYDCSFIIIIDCDTSHNHETY